MKGDREFWAKENGVWHHHVVFEGIYFVDGKRVDPSSMQHTIWLK